MRSDPDTRGQADARDSEAPEASGKADSSVEGSEADRAYGPERWNPLLFSFSTLALIAFGVWIFLGSKRYRAEYADTTQGWRVGTSRVVELTVVREDKTNLACASEHTLAGLRCAYGRPKGPLNDSMDERTTLQPYNTLSGELLLGAGLWTCPDMKRDLPAGRFSVVCNYNIKGVMKSARIRFDPSAAFGPLGRTVTVGTLTECMVPR